MIFSTLEPDLDHSPSNPTREEMFHREIEEKNSKLQIRNWLSLLGNLFGEFGFLLFKQN